MESTIHKRMRVIVLLAWTTLCLCQCPDGQYTCPDTIRGMVCYDSAVTSCVLDSSLGFYRLCGAGLSSCGGVCFKPGSSSCDGTVLLKPTAQETSTPPAEAAAEIHVDTEQPDTPSTAASPDESSSLPEVNSSGKDQEPLATATATAPASDPFFAANTSPLVPSTSSGADHKNSTASSTAGTYTPYKTKTRQPVNSYAPVPAPNPGPGGAPPQYSPLAVQNTTADPVDGTTSDSDEENGTEASTTSTPTVTSGFDNDNDTVSSTTSSTIYIPYKAKTRQPVDTNFAVPAPNPGPGGAPPQQPFKRTGDIADFPSASFDPMASRRRMFDR